MNRIIRKARVVLTLTVIGLATIGTIGSGTANATSAAHKGRQKTFACAADVTIHSTALTHDGAKVICSKLEATRKTFLDVFNSGQLLQNAPGDQTTGLDLYVFRNNAEYVANAKALGYDASSNANENAGQTIEGDPRRAGNRATAVVRAFDNGINNPLNLEHEFVHYLDLRYNVEGDSDSPIWWCEGIAEQLGNPNDYVNAAETVRDGQWTLSEILANDSLDDQDLVYSGGHVTVEYLLTEQPELLDEMLATLIDGDVNAYQAWVNSIGSGLDADFDNWLVNQ